MQSEKYKPAEEDIGMKEITLTIDGKVCKGVQGDTILDVANKTTYIYRRFVIRRD